MDDRDRLNSLLARLSSVTGLDQTTYDRLIGELNRPVKQAGKDAQGPLNVAMFDVRSYDIESFGNRNRGRFAIHSIEAALNVETANAAAGCKIVCIFVNDKCDVAVIEKLASLGVELIALRCAGFNNVDLRACRQYGISVVRVPAYSPHAVAEHTVALMLTLNRHLHLAYQRNRAGYFVIDGLTGFDMRGKTVGVVGTGRIGCCVVEILLGFGCRVLAFDNFPNERIAGMQGVRYTEIGELLQESDIVTLHVPLFDQTRHLINPSSIEQMKNGVMLINTSRGGLLDTRALIAGLKSGKIGSAGLDVYEEEAGVFFHDMSDKGPADDVLARLMTFNNVVVTSHQAFLTHEALANIADATLESIEEFAAGKRGDELSHAVVVAETD